MPAQKPIAERIKAAEAKAKKQNDKLRRLQLEAKQEAEKRNLQRRLLIADTILAARETDAEVAAGLSKILAKYVSHPPDRELIADLINSLPLKSGQKPAEESATD
jgi:hypothetical protein